MCVCVCVCVHLHAYVCMDACAYRCTLSHVCIKMLTANCVCMRVSACVGVFFINVFLGNLGLGIIPFELVDFCIL